MWKVLLVDDEESIRKLLKAVLEMEQFSVDAADSARSAIALLAAGTYDVVVTDLRMETYVAGYDVARAAFKLDPRPLIVIVTAFPVPISEWRSVGAHALFTKGSDTLQLASHLVKLLEQREAAPEHSGQHHRSRSMFRRDFS